MVSFLQREECALLSWCAFTDFFYFFFFLSALQRVMRVIREHSSKDFRKQDNMAEKLGLQRYVTCKSF